MEEINYSLIIVSAIAAIASPEPAMAGTLMNYGQRLDNRRKPRRCITYSSIRCYPARS